MYFRYRNNISVNSWHVESFMRRRTNAKGCVWFRGREYIPLTRNDGGSFVLSNNIYFPEVYVCQVRCPWWGELEYRWWLKYCKVVFGHLIKCLANLAQPQADGVDWSYISLNKISSYALHVPNKKASSNTSTFARRPYATISLVLHAQGTVLQSILL